MTEICDQTVVENEFAVFECEVSHKKIPVEWYLNDVEIVPGPKYQVFAEDCAHRLAVNLAAPEDSGEVKVVFRKASCYAKLTVTGEGMR